MWLTVLLFLAGLGLVGGQLSRLDGVLLLAGYVAAVAFLAQQQRRGADVTPLESVEGLLSGERPNMGRWGAPP